VPNRLSTTGQEGKGRQNMVRTSALLAASLLFISSALADDRADAELAYATCLMVGMENQIQPGKNLDIYIEACMRVKNWVRPSGGFTGDDDYVRLSK
jgi:hypothetical protein